MPEKKTTERAKKDKSEGKSASTQAGEYVHEEMEHIKEGKHGARSTKQAIAIGLSKARRAGVNVPAGRHASAGAKKQAAHDSAKGKSSDHKTSVTRSRATAKALRKEGHSAASKTALSRHAKASARQRTASERSASAKKAARTRAANKG